MDLILTDVFLPNPIMFMFYNGLFDLPVTNLNFCFLGDLFTALTTAWLKHDDFNIVSALEKTISTMQTVLRRTLSYAMSKSGGSDPSPGQLELKLIQSREDILNPNVEIKATRIV